VDKQLPAQDQQPFFRVVPDVEHDVCQHCKKGAFITVVYTDEDGEECSVGISWEADGDGPALAEEHADTLNWAFELGRQSFVRDFNNIRAECQQHPDLSERLTDIDPDWRTKFQDIDRAAEFYAERLK
jgi:hypothetical protein